jgi:hypothetical protein
MCHSPQSYEHRVALVIEATACAVAGVNQLVNFLLEQEGPHWREQNAKVTEASKELRKATKWLKGVDRFPDAESDFAKTRIG